LILGSLALGVALPAYAQDQRDQQEDKDKEKPAQEKEKKAQPEKSAKPEEKRAAEQNNSKPEEKRAQDLQDKGRQPEQKSVQEQHAQGRPEQHAGARRIPDDRFKANFGREHSFRVSEGDYRNHRFQYGGYWFGFESAWPSNWLYTQDVYVIEINGVYYLCNASYPGVNLTLSVTL
jgi:hypothetical protein